jgi:multidrug resistance efflux pump
MDNDPSRLEARLLQAIRELRVLKEKNQAAIEQLVRLSEAITVLVKTSGEIKTEARVAVEAELRETAQILGASEINAFGIETNLQDAQVVDFKEDLSLLVANVGTANGVKVGMPFKILRDGQLIGNAKVIDVRERISGAVIQNLSSENTRVEKGDLLRVDAKK